MVLLRDLFYYTWRCGRTRKSWALGAPNAHSDGRMSPAFSDAVFLFALCALLCLLSVWPGTCWFNLNRLRLIQHRSPRASRLLFIVAFLVRCKIIMSAGWFAIGDNTVGFRCQGRPAGCALKARWRAVLFCMPMVFFTAIAAHAYQL